MPITFPGSRASIARTLTVLVAVASALLVLPSSSFAGAVTTTPTQRAVAAKVAASKVGAKYVSGTAGPRTFDCSGLVVFAFAHAGVSLPNRTSQAMWAAGAKVKPSALKRGDLVYTWDTAKGHVGIFLGAGKYVHAPASGRTVEIAPLPKVGAGFVGAVRP